MRHFYFAEDATFELSIDTDTPLPDVMFSEASTEPRAQLDS